MARIRCPQCGTEFEKGNLQFCPNPNCGYPVAFLEEGKLPEEPPRMERRPGETVDQPMQPMPPTPQAPPAPPRPPRNLRPLLFAGGAIAVVLIIVVAFLLLKGGGGKEGPKAGGTTSSVAPSKKPSQKPSASPSTTPTKPSAGIQLTWVPVDPQSDLRGTGDQVMNAMAGTPKENGTLVAAGSTVSVGENDAAVWRSTDGRTWSLVTGQSDLGGPGEQQINGINPVKGGGFIVVGSDTSSGSADAAVWLSPDGTQWSKVSSPALGGPGKQSMNRVASTGTPVGTLGVGSTTNSEDGTQDGAIWKSPDGGHSWQLLPVEQFGGPGDQDIKRVAVLKSGITTGFVAVGTSTLNGDSDAAVWTSSDGIDWTRAPDPNDELGGSGNQGMADVQSFGDELIAAGFDTSKNGRDGAIWTSSNGTDWTEVNSAQLGGRGDQVIIRLVATKEVEGIAVPPLIAAGTTTENGDLDAAIWYSTDGTTWNRETSTAAAFGGQNAQSIHTMAQHGDTLVAVGFDASGGDENAGVWIAQPPPAT
jgi:hypothetical protein